mmetsp:Transcript_18350/g.40806  ORF Transcript_18350/g.40806 Transcript_18350/m.40806 type:complete len:253 (-) Transcript_18350:342-1100(-)
MRRSWPTLTVCVCPPTVRAMPLMPPIRCMWQCMRISVFRSHRSRQRSLHPETHSVSSSKSARQVTFCLCSLRCEISSRDRNSHNRTSPLGPPERTKRRLWLRQRAVTPPGCALSSSHRLSPVSALLATILPSDHPEMRMLAKAKHCGTAPRSCSRRAWLVDTTAYSTMSHTFNVPSIDAVANRSFCPSSNATLRMLSVWLSAIRMLCREVRFTRATVPVAVVARHSRRSGLADKLTTGPSSGISPRKSPPCP